MAIRLYAARRNCPMITCTICNKVQTLEADGVCLICKSEEKNRKPIYGIIEMRDADCGNSDLNPKSEIVTPQSENGGDGMKEFSAGHRTCEIEGCEKFAVKERKCTRHYNEAHGIVKKRGHPGKKGKKTTSADHNAPQPPLNLRGGGTTSTKSLANIGKNVILSETKNLDIIQKLMAERDRIDAAIEVIKQYA
jgi:hypothetical protein